MGLWPFIRIGTLCGLLAASLAAGGCAPLGTPTVSERSPGGASQPSRRAGTPAKGVYVVRRGDTLYAISRQTGVTVSNLARLNRLRPPYQINPGMKLRLSGRAVAQAPSSSRRAQSSSQHTQAQPKAARAPSKPSPVGAIGWRWPTTSPVVKEFGGINKGLDFSVAPGSKVTSASAGEVVYAGAGLAGFERLVIVRHNAQYLSAYSVNQPLSVQEGQQIKAGQVIASINDNGRTAQALHFEIRKNGKPISPRSVLR